MLGLFRLSQRDDERPQNAFGSTKVCPKCGGRKFERGFVQFRSAPEFSVYYHEHIEAHCLKCGASFWEKCKDDIA